MWKVTDLTLKKGNLHSNLPQWLTTSWWRKKSRWLNSPVLGNRMYCNNEGYLLRNQLCWRDLKVVQNLLPFANVSPDWFKDYTLFCSTYPWEYIMSCCHVFRQVKAVFLNEAAAIIPEKVVCVLWTGHMFCSAEGFWNRQRLNFLHQRLSFRW